MTKLFIAIPTHDGKLFTDFVVSLFSLTQLLSGVNIGFTIKYLQGSHINRSRNMLVDYFLQSDCSHLLFLDTDLVGYENHVEVMVDMDRDIVGGLYSTKSIEMDLLAWNLANGVHPLMATKFYVNLNDSVEESREQLTKFGYCKVKNVGTGCMLIKRKVFEKLMDVFPCKKIKVVASENERHYYYNFFDSFIHPTEGHYLSEDYGFCHLCQQLRIQIYAIDMFPLYHIGSFFYTGKFTNYLKFLESRK